MSFKQRKSPFCLRFFYIFSVAEIYTRDTHKNVRERLMDPVHTHKKRFTMRQVAGSSSSQSLIFIVVVLEFWLFWDGPDPSLTPDDDEICGCFFFSQIIFCQFVLLLG